MNDPRGPLRKYTKIDNSSGKHTLVYFVCGHVGEFNPIYDYSCDAEHRCFNCGPHGTKEPLDQHLRTIVNSQE